MIAGAGMHMCGLSSDSRMSCWGQPFDGGSTTFQHLSVGEAGGCGIDSNNRLVCSTTSGVLNPSLIPNEAVRAVAVGSQHVCTLRLDGTPRCWGTGPGTRAPTTGGFSAIAASRDATCALRNGTPVCWGNAYPAPGLFAWLTSSPGGFCGRRNNGTGACWGTDFAIDDDALEGPFVGLDASVSNVCGHRADGSVQCTGDKFPFGGPRDLPPSDGIFKATSSAADNFPTRICGWDRTTGLVTCSGDSTGLEVLPDRYQRLPDSSAYRCGVRLGGGILCASYPPMTPFNVGYVLDVSMGTNGGCLLLHDATAMCWGTYFIGSEAPPAGQFADVAVYGSAACGLRPSGTIECWGMAAPPPPAVYTSMSFAADGKRTALRSDGAIVGWTDYTHTVRAGPYTMFDGTVQLGCGVLTSGEVDCWDTTGQLPAGPLNVVTGVPNGSDFVDVSFETTGATARRADGSFVRWGRGASPQGLTEISVAGAFACGIAPDQRLVCWGRTVDANGAYREFEARAGAACAIRDTGAVACWADFDNALDEPPSGQFRDLALTDGVACAIRESDDRAVCWGRINGAFETAPPDLPMAQLAMGAATTCGLTTDGAIACWRFASGVNPPSGTFTAIATSGTSFCALRPDGLPTCWGTRRGAAETPPEDTFVDLVGGHLYYCGLRSDGEVRCWGSAELVERGANQD